MTYDLIKKKGIKTMKKLFSKLGSLLLAAAILMSLVPAALADNVAVRAISARTITVNEIAQGDTVKAYRLVKYADTSYNSFQFYSDFGTFLDHFASSTATPMTKEAYLATMSAEGIANVLGGYASAALAGHVGFTLPTDTSEVVSATAGADEKATLSLQPGYYLLLVETTVNNSKIYKAMSVFMRVKGDDVHVYAGGTDVTLDPQMTAKHANAPAIHKQVKDESGVGATWKSSAAANVGDDLEYYVHLEIPAYSGVQNLPTLTLKDTLSGAQYVPGSAKVYQTVNPVDKEIANAIKTPTVGNYENGTQTLTFELDYSKLTSSVGTVDVYIVYHATLMPEAVSANKQVNPADPGNSTVFNYAENSAVLTYVTDLEPSNVKTTDPSATRVYTFSLRLTKIDTEGDALSGAGFTFYRSEADLTNESAVGIKFVKDGGYYRPATADEIAAGTGVVTEVPADFLIKGLNVGVYYMEETTVPGGYYAPKGGFKVDLTGERTAEAITGLLANGSTMTELNNSDRLLLGGSALDTANVNQLDVTLKNSTTPILPTTGGMGTALFTIGGVALMAAAAAIVILRRKRGE